MGSLHAGHTPLIEEAPRQGDVVVVTIFVNPLQFDVRDDFDKYPRPIDHDLEACRAAGVHAVYAPTAAAMYPPGFQTSVEPGPLADTLEGSSRPGHFRGVTTVVAKLFGAVQPDLAVLGQKDFQQLVIIRRMVLDLDMGLTIVEVPTVREPDGLAISSRNQRLTDKDRKAAVCLFQALQTVEQAVSAGEHDSSRLESLALDRIAAEPRANLEYVHIVDPATLAAVDVLQQSAVVVIAARFGDVR